MAAIDFPNSPSNGTTHTVGNITWTYNSTKGVWSITGGVGVTTGTTNNVAKYSTANTIGNSIIYDNGTSVGVGTSSPTSNIRMSISGNGSLLALNIPNITETATISATAATGTINYDLTTQSVLYYTTNASANWTVNFRASSTLSLNNAMTTGQAITAVFMVTQGATAWYNSAVQVDGSAVTPKWQGGSAPTSGNASGIDVYAYTIIKTGSAAFTVLASQTAFA